MRSHVQRWIDNTASPWFPVTVPLPSLNPHDLRVIYSQQSKPAVDATHAPAQEENYGVLHQFLHKKKWLERINGLSHETLIPLVSYSNYDSLYGTLHIQLVSFFSTMQRITESHYYLCRLISTRPAEEHDDTKFHHHRSVNAPTLDAYARLVAGWISFIHRVTTNPLSPYKIHIPPSIATACDQLVSSLSPPPRNDEMAILDRNRDPVDFTGYDSDDESDIGDGDETTHQNHNTDPTQHSNGLQPTVQQCLTHLLYLLFTQVPSGDLRGQFFSSPTTSSLPFVTINNGPLSTTITHNIAAFLFTGRLIFACKIDGAIGEKCTISE